MYFKCKEIISFLTSVNNAIENSENKSKHAWAFFNNEIEKIKTNVPINKLQVNGYEATNNLEIANIMSYHYATCAKTIYNNNPDDDSTTEEEASETEFEDIIIEEDDIIEAIKYLKVNKPLESDGIPAKFYKLCAQDIAPILKSFCLKCHDKDKWHNATYIHTLHQY